MSSFLQRLKMHCHWGCISLFFKFPYQPTILHDTARYCRILPDTAEYCRILAPGIAPNAGIAPAASKGDSTRSVLLHKLRLCFTRDCVAPDQGAAGVTWLFRRQAQRPRVQAIFLCGFYVGGGGHLH